METSGGVASLHAVDVRGVRREAAEHRPVAAMRTAAHVRVRGDHPERLVGPVDDRARDISRGLEEKVQPYCDQFMNSLLNNLRSAVLGNQFKPAILQCFGDIAQAIGGAF